MHLKSIIAVLIAAGLTACSFQEVQTQQDEGIPATNIGAVISAIDTNPFFQGMYRSLESVAAENKQLELQLESSQNNQELQDQQIEKMIANGAKALVVNLADAKVGKDFATKMCARGTPVVYINRSPGNKALQDCEIAHFVSSDDRQAGMLQAEKVLTAWKVHSEWDKNADGKMQIAVLVGNPAITSAKPRADWVAESLKFHPQHGLGSGKVEVLLRETAQYNQQVAQELIKTWAANNPEFEQVEVIVAGNDNMALGAAAALETLGKKIPVFGIDATPAGQEGVKSGRIFATIVNDYDTQVRVAVRMAANLATQRPVLEGLSVDMDESGTVLVPLRSLN